MRAPGQRAQSHLKKYFVLEKSGFSEWHPYGSCWNSSLRSIPSWCPLPRVKHINHNSSLNMSPSLPPIFLFLLRGSHKYPSFLRHCCRTTWSWFDVLFLAFSVSACKLPMFFFGGNAFYLIKDSWCTVFKTCNNFFLSEQHHPPRCRNLTGSSIET